MRRHLLIAFTLLLTAAACWQWQHHQERTQLRSELLRLRQGTRSSLYARFENMKHQFTPGYKSLAAYGPGLLWTQGEIFRTQLATNLAINGMGCFGVKRSKEFRLTRDGRFQFDAQGRLCNEHGWTLQAFQVDRLGNVCSDPGDVVLALDPNTKLYGGRYTGFRFDETGKLYGEVTQTDPVTGQLATLSEPLYQVAIYGVNDPRRLQHAEHPTLLRTTETSVVGVAGQGALGQICPASLELSNVDFMREGAHIGSLKQVWQSMDCLPASDSADVRWELIARIRRDRQFKAACLENLTRQLEPGYRSWDILAVLCGEPLRRREEAGPSLVTQNPFDLTVRGDGELVLDNGQTVRSASFTPDQQGMRCEKGYLTCRDGKLFRLEKGVTNLEFCADGVVRGTDLNGAGTPRTLGRLALAGFGRYR